jgi:hypothetical protein
VKPRWLWGERFKRLEVSFGVAEFHAGLLAPKKVGYQHHVALFGVAVSKLPHRGVDAEDLLRKHQARAAATGRHGEIALEAAAAVKRSDV